MMLPVMTMAERQRQLETLNVEQTFYWGPLVFKTGLTLVVAESSAGKTVFMYRLAHALTAGNEFLGLKPPRPLKVLHVDWESPVLAEKINLAAMSAYDRPLWHTIPKETSITMPELIEGTHDYDVIIVDSLQTFSPVENEDDNAMANKQMEQYRQLALHSGAAVIVTHNAGKGDSHSKFKSRGASNRVDRADMVLNYNVRPDGRRELVVVKSRIGYINESMEFCFEGTLNYRLVRAFSEKSTKGETMAERVKEFLKEMGMPVPRKTIAGLYKIERDTAEDKVLSRALRMLVVAGAVYQNEKGEYLLT